jgi:hypothetical protein
MKQRNPWDWKGTTAKAPPPAAEVKGKKGKKAKKKPAEETTADEFVGDSEPTADE